MRHTICCPVSRYVRWMLTTATVVCWLTASVSAQWTVVNLHPAGATNSYAYGVHGSQQVGAAVVSGNEHASLWSGSAESWVDLNPTGATSSRASCTYGAQQAGWAQFPTNLRAGLWSGSAGSWTDLTPPGGPALIYGIDCIQQAGYTFNSSEHAGLWSGSAGSWVDLNPSEATRSMAKGVFSGWQVGWVYIVPHYHASLWNSSAESWVDLNPAAADWSAAEGVYFNQQVGEARLGSVWHASLWTGTGTSWVDLQPSVARESQAYDIYGDKQVGVAFMDNGFEDAHASLWYGTAASWVDLQALLPSHFGNSYANGIWEDGAFTYVVGYAYNTTTARAEALMWVGCRLPGDLNHDDAINGLDIQLFVNFVIEGSGGLDSLCGDLTGDGSVTADDIEPFVTRILGS